MWFNPAKIEKFQHVHAANSANSANPESEISKLARLATGKNLKTTDRHSEISKLAKLAGDQSAQVGAGDTAIEAGTAYRAWLIHYADRDPVESYCAPPATHAEILASHPDAIAAEPIKEAIPDEAAPEFREQYAHAREDVPEEENADGMITCRQCGNRRYDGVCKVAEPTFDRILTKVCRQSRLYP